MNGTYGLTPRSPNSPNMGAGLAGLADQKEQAAFGMARTAAQNETNLNLAKDNFEREKKAGNTQMGAMAGAQIGSFFGPLGTVIGGLFGAVAGGAFK